jgi:DNA-binding response OmpR family regulator
MAATPLRIKLLAIDDDPQSLELVSEALSDNGLQIFTAHDPERGLELSAPTSC